MARLVMTTEPLRGADSATLRDVFDEDDLAWAEANGSTVFLVDEETGNPGEVLYNGTEWLYPKPIYVRPAELVIPSVDYVNQNAEVVQSEVEAILDVVAVAVADKVPAKTVRALKQNIATARAAMKSGDPIAVATIAQTLSDTPDTSLFSIERAKEVTNGSGAEAAG